jgi:hypothetical protein
MRRIFWGFCRNWFLIDPLHNFSSRSDFGFEFAEIFEKQLPDLPSRGVSDSPTRRVGESKARPDMASRLLNDSKENLASRRVGDSSTRRVGESLTPRLDQPGSRYGAAIRIFFNLSSNYSTLNG